MATPKRKTSKSDRDKRRSHLALSVPGMIECPNCMERTFPHRACIHCGQYKGRTIIQKEDF